MTSKKSHKNILELEAQAAHGFLMEPESYCSFDLPPYFSFDQILNETRRELQGQDIKELFKGKKSGPNAHEDVNYTLLHNKDGRYAWRPLQLIHPTLYASLVKKITEPSAWDTIIQRFKRFSAIENIKCESLPLHSLTRKKDKAEQISHWWDSVEQKSIELSLEYEYLAHTDICDCYSSIYTHSIAWAIHSRSTAKKHRRDDTLIGNIIDQHIGYMTNGQTNGIPQGSVLMDFIAEMILGYVDLKLSEKIDEKGINDFHIIRYRDDYRVFVNNPETADQILKLLTTVLFDIGLKLNPSKTKTTSEVIRGSIKADKLFWLAQKQGNKNPEKHLLIIHDLAHKFPNSGSLCTALDNYYKKILAYKRKHMIPALIAIVTDIMYRNPKPYPVLAAILSHFVSLVEVDKRKLLVEKIRARLSKVPNTGYLDIWIQRFAFQLDNEAQYKEPLCKLAGGQKVTLWNSQWLKPKTDMAAIMRLANIIDLPKLHECSSVIQPHEFSPFVY